MKKKKIAFVLRTVGLEYDDRIRKECISLKEKYDITIFAHFYNNLEEEGITSYGIPYKSYKLYSRLLIPSSKLLFVKAFELFNCIRKDIKEYDYIWAHEEYTFMFPLLLKHKYIIWDLHEIPSHFSSRFLRSVFIYIEKKCFKIIHANNNRINYLKSIELIKYPLKHSSIRNFPDNVFINSVSTPVIFKNFVKWLGDDDFVYLQGLTVQDRYPYNSIAAILESTNFKIIVVGSFEHTISLNRLTDRYGDLLSKRVYFAGMIDQLSIPSLLRKAKFSIVLYDTSDPNNRFCEANRFYQSIVLGIPTICGNNESMAEIINEDEVGVVLDSDGRDINNIITSIKILLSNYSYYKENCEKYKSKYVWNTNLNIDIDA